MRAMPPPVSAPGMRPCVCLSVPCDVALTCALCPLVRFQLRNQRMWLFPVPLLQLQSPQTLCKCPTRRSRTQSRNAAGNGTRRSLRGACTGSPRPDLSPPPRSRPLMCECILPDCLEAGLTCCAGCRDGTLTETNSGGTFAKNASDWHWLYPVIPAKLKELHDDGESTCVSVSMPACSCYLVSFAPPCSISAGFKIVIISNQKGVDSGKTPLADVQGRFEQIARAAGMPMQLFFATDDSFYRKVCFYS